MSRTNWFLLAPLPPPRNQNEPRYAWMNSKSVCESPGPVIIITALLERSSRDCDSRRDKTHGYSKLILIQRASICDFRCKVLYAFVFHFHFGRQPEATKMYRKIRNPCRPQNVNQFPRSWLPKDGEVKLHAAPWRLPVRVSRPVTGADKHPNDNCWRHSINCCPRNKPAQPWQHQFLSRDRRSVLVEPLSRGFVPATGRSSSASSPCSPGQARACDHAGIDARYRSRKPGISERR